MSSVARALQILEFVSGASQAPTHAELARQFRIPKSTLSQLLALLSETRYLALIGRQYHPGIGLTALAFRVAYEGGLRVSIRPAMEDLALRSGETVVLATRVGMSIVIVEQAPSPRPIRYVTALGTLRPIHATATGRVFLAFGDQSSASLGTLAKVTPATVTDPARLDALLREVRRDGYAISREEAIPGVTSIAAPVLGANGQPIAALAVTGPSERLSDIRERVWPLLRATTREVQRAGRDAAPPAAHEVGTKKRSPGRRTGRPSRR